MQFFAFDRLQPVKGCQMPVPQAKGYQDAAEL
jgi:hypothetical protein